MKSTIIGPGRVGGAVSLALAHAGHPVVAVAGGKKEDQTAFTERLDPTPKVVTVSTIPKETELIVIATPDDAVRSVVAELTVNELVGKGTRVIHTSGAHGLEILAPLAACGAGVAACHPAMTFPDVEQGYINLPLTTWAVTASDDDLVWARMLVVDLGGSPVSIAAKDRTLYHTGLTVGSNATTAVVSLARDLLFGAGVSDPGAFLDPLTTASAHSGSMHGATALTGPVARGDVETIQAHLDELRTSFPEAVPTYVELGRLILAQAVRVGLEHEKSEAINEIFDRNS